MKKFTCGHCGGRIAVNPRHLGNLVVCPECGKPTHPLAGDILAASKSGPPAGRALSAEPVGRKCENCGRAVGRLEAVHLWNNHLVCDDCHPRLARVSPTTSTGGPAHPAAVNGANGGPGKSAGTAGSGIGPAAASPADAPPSKRAAKPRKSRLARALLPGPAPAPVPAEGGVTAVPSADSQLAPASAQTMIFDRSPGTMLAAASAAAVAASAAAPIAVKVARVWPWRRGGRPPAAGAHGGNGPPVARPSIRQRLVWLSVAAVVAGTALYGALTLVLAVASIITKVAIGLLAFAAVIVGLWLAVFAVRRYVPWPPSRRRARGTADGSSDGTGSGDASAGTPTLVDARPPADVLARRG